MVASTSTSLPIFQSKVTELQLMQTSWSSKLNPLLSSTSTIGNVFSQSVVLSNAINLTSGVPVNIGSVLTLQSGLYLLSGAVGFSPTGTTAEFLLQGAISLTPRTIPSGDTIAVPSAAGESRIAFGLGGITPAGDISFSMPISIISLTKQTNYYLVAAASFATSTLQAYGSISAIQLGTN